VVEKGGGKGWVSWSPRTWKFNRHRTKLNDRASCLRRKAQTWKSGRWEEKARRNGGVAFGSPRCNQLMCVRLVFAKGQENINPLITIAMYFLKKFKIVFSR